MRHIARRCQCVYAVCAFVRLYRRADRRTTAAVGFRVVPACIHVCLAHELQVHLVIEHWSLYLKAGQVNPAISSQTE